MRSYNYVDVTARKTAERLLLLLWRAEAGYHIHVDREISHSAHRRLIMLERKDGRRHENCNLLARQNRLVRRAECDLGLTVANVTAKQSVHGDGTHHVLLYVAYRVCLTVGLVVVKRLLKASLHLVVGKECVAGLPHSLGVELDKLLCHLLDRALGSCSRLFPALAAHF